MEACLGLSGEKLDDTKRLAWSFRWDLVMRLISFLLRRLLKRCLTCVCGLHCEVFAALLDDFLLEIRNVMSTVFYSCVFHQTFCSMH